MISVCDVTLRNGISIPKLYEYSSYFFSNFYVLIFTLTV